MIPQLFDQHGGFFIGQVEDLGRDMGAECHWRAERGFHSMLAASIAAIAASFGPLVRHPTMVGTGFDDREAEVYRASHQAGSGNDINAGSAGSHKAPT
jgi:hypothetical protein